eukprot:CAMPEP_0194167362 /NCGR_PEP_ID=MMETSP0154-20130528/2670_1 /TAXON_ID=1049557 /ORGANISM="Thalassiothrix antarctica, Strain L6-D1" /LENGTH=94 /DNA_ID=CAMNT_0038878249 /DNA_START=71 /DNA_END=355 /DNA_ORIENTATION=+
MSSMKPVVNYKNRNEENNQPTEMSLLVGDMLDQMKSKFKAMGNSIMSRMDDMGNRMDELEISIGELMDQAGLAEAPTVPSSPKSEDRQTRRISI